MRMDGPENSRYIVEIGDIIQCKDNHTLEYRVVQVIDDSVIYCVPASTEPYTVNELYVLEDPQNYFIPLAEELES